MYRAGLGNNKNNYYFLHSAGLTELNYLFELCQSDFFNIFLIFGLSSEEAEVSFRCQSVFFVTLMVSDLKRAVTDFTACSASPVIVGNI